jgi:hypothetical protein
VSAEQIAASMTDVQRREVAGCVADLIRICDKIADEGISVGDRECDDPAQVLCDMTTSLGLDDWALIPEIVQHVIKGRAP